MRVQKGFMFDVQTNWVRDRDLHGKFFMLVNFQKALNNMQAHSFYIMFLICQIDLFVRK